jgi:hypothetical protein
MALKVTGIDKLDLSRTDQLAVLTLTLFCLPLSHRYTTLPSLLLLLLKNIIIMVITIYL